MSKGMQIQSLIPIAQEAILHVIDRIWVEEISNCICSIISREILCPR
jgi:hypothetical protein